MIYELTTMHLHLWGTKKAVEGILNYKNTSQSNGRLLGCWKVEIGPIGPDCLLILREFDNSEDLLKERNNFLLSNNPFGVGDVLNSFKVESFIPFPFMPPIKAGQLGPIYEFREYQLAVGGIKKSIDAWEKALPARQKISPVIIAMYALDGPARIMHIIGYESFEFRLNVRQELYQKGIWPPKGAPEEIIKATNMIALPTSISQLT
jgi:hypothetical protein